MAVSDWPNSSCSSAASSRRSLSCTSISWRVRRRWLSRARLKLSASWSTTWAMAANSRKAKPGNWARSWPAARRTSPALSSLTGDRAWSTANQVRPRQMPQNSTSMMSTCTEVESFSRNSLSGSGLIHRSCVPTRMRCACAPSMDKPSHGSNPRGWAGVPGLMGSGADMSSLTWRNCPGVKAAARRAGASSSGEASNNSIRCTVACCSASASSRRSLSHTSPNRSNKTAKARVNRASSVRRKSMAWVGSGTFADIFGKFGAQATPCVACADR